MGWRVWVYKIIRLIIRLKPPSLTFMYFPSKQSVSAEVMWCVRDHRQKTFGFLNRLCLLISNPLPPLINRQPCFLIQHRYLILILALVTHTYTIHTCIYTVYIPILYLFDTCIPYFFTVLYRQMGWLWTLFGTFSFVTSVWVKLWTWFFQCIANRYCQVNWWSKFLI